MDIFAGGIVLYSLIEGNYPEFDYIYDKKGNVIGFNTDVEIENYFYSDLFDNVEESMKELIKSMITFDYLQRPDAKALLKNGLFANQLNLTNVSSDDESNYLY